MKLSRVHLLAVLSIFAFAAVPTFAASASYTIGLSGSVSATCSLAIDITSTASALPLTTKATNTAIATVTERSNATGGYTVTLASQNGWLIKGTTASNNASLAYTVTYGGGAITTSGVAAGSPTTLTDTTTSSTGTVKILAISFDGSQSLLPADNYADTLTLTIASK